MAPVQISMIMSRAASSSSWMLLIHSASSTAVACTAVSSSPRQSPYWQRHSCGLIPIADAVIIAAFVGITDGATFLVMSRSRETITGIISASGSLPAASNASRNHLMNR